MRPINDCDLPPTGDQTLHLLEDLAAAVKLPYLSDLRALTAYPLLLCALDGILPAQYAPADWPLRGRRVLSALFWARPATPPHTVARRAICSFCCGRHSKKRHPQGCLFL